MNDKGLLIVLSGPSGTGKGTIVKKLLEKNSTCLSVSMTTRTPRVGEEEGKSYFFVSRETFLEKVEQGKMLEYAEYNGNFYGTPREFVEQKSAAGQDVILEIEVQGALKVKSACPDAVMVFIMAPNMQELKNRLVMRKTEDEQTIQNRMNIAKRELEKADQYDYIVINDTVDKAAEDILAIIGAEKCSKKRREKFINEVKKQC